MENKTHEQKHVDTRSYAHIKRHQYNDKKLLIDYYVGFNVPKPPYDYDRRRIVEGSGNINHLRFFNVHPNLSTRAYGIFACIENAAAAAGS